MHNPIAEIGNHDLHNAVKTLYCLSQVLRHIPQIHADTDTKTALYESAKMAIRSARIVLGNILDRLESLDCDQ